ncbi:MAG: hypothetical protein EKK45_00320 [Curvibacter sp.]|nr:MAG: hypothetical protein EKK45_00320 [Curvibacter sp.]
MKEPKKPLPKPQEPAPFRHPVSPFEPVSQFLGHSLAAAIGFVGLALISRIPVLILSLIAKWLGMELPPALHVVEELMFWADVILFTVVFASGVVIFLVEMYVETKIRIIEALQRRT